MILIDEYDAPVGHALGDVGMAEAIRDRMSALYSRMKNRTGDIRFLLMTGISKFTRLSVFSALSNLVDVSQRAEYATMFGYTEEELSANFEEHLRAHAVKMGKPYAEYRAEMKRWYNGFRFSPDVETTVYNPVSVALTLDEKSGTGFKATWATTGRPSMLMNYLKREDVLRINPESMQRVRASSFDVAELRNLRPVAMLFQSGYLTVKDYNPMTELYTLGVPDEEVRRDFSTLMTGVAADKDMQWAASLGDRLLSEEWDVFFDGLKSLYAGMAYGSTERSVHENSYGRCLSFLLASCGFDYTMEAMQSNGRADVVAKHPALVCIFELKVDEPVDRAFLQIRDKNYAAPYMADGRPIWFVGLSFDSKTRHRDDLIYKRIESYLCSGKRDIDKIITEDDYDLEHFAFPIDIYTNPNHRKLYGYNTKLFREDILQPLGLIYRINPEKMVKAFYDLLEDVRVVSNDKWFLFDSINNLLYNNKSFMLIDTLDYYKMDKNTLDENIAILLKAIEIPIYMHTKNDKFCDESSIEEIASNVKKYVKEKKYY